MNAPLKITFSLRRPSQNPTVVKPTSHEVPKEKQIDESSHAMSSSSPPALPEYSRETSNNLEDDEDELTVDDREDSIMYDDTSNSVSAGVSGSSFIFDTNAFSNPSSSYGGSKLSQGGVQKKRPKKKGQRLLPRRKELPNRETRTNVDMGDRIYQRRRQPLNVILKKLIDTLRQKDVYGFFLRPVDTKLVPDYLNVIKEPMDFGTMLAKVESNAYTHCNEFQHDFDLVINNAKKFNPSESIYHKEALRIGDLGTKLIDRESQLVKYDDEFDWRAFSTGSVEPDLVYQGGSILKHLMRVRNVQRAADEAAKKKLRKGRHWEDLERGLPNIYYGDGTRKSEAEDLFSKDPILDPLCDSERSCFERFLNRRRPGFGLDFNQISLLAIRNSSWFISNQTLDPLPIQKDFPFNSLDNFLYGTPTGLTYKWSLESFAKDMLGDKAPSAFIQTQMKKLDGGSRAVLEGLYRALTPPETASDDPSILEGILRIESELGTISIADLLYTYARSQVPEVYNNTMAFVESQKRGNDTRVLEPLASLTLEPGVALLKTPDDVTEFLGNVAKDLKKLQAMRSPSSEEAQTLRRSLEWRLWSLSRKCGDSCFRSYENAPVPQLVTRPLLPASSVSPVSSTKSSPRIPSEGNTSLASPSILAQFSGPSATSKSALHTLSNAFRAAQLCLNCRNRISDEVARQTSALRLLCLECGAYFIKHKRHRPIASLPEVAFPSSATPSKSSKR